MLLQVSVLKKKPEITLVTNKAAAPAQSAPAAQPAAQAQVKPKVEAPVEPVVEKAAQNVQVTKPAAQPSAPSTSPAAGVQNAGAAQAKPDQKEDYLDIPAFLRRQAD